MIALKHVHLSHFAARATAHADVPIMRVEVYTGRRCDPGFRVASTMPAAWAGIEILRVVRTISLACLFFTMLGLRTG
jgi:hypothetical protein